MVFLHGGFGRGTDNKKQLRSGVEEFATDQARKKHPCFLAIPQCPPDKQWTNVGWFDGKRNVPQAAPKHCYITDAPPNRIDANWPTCLQRTTRAPRISIATNNEFDLYR